MSKVNDSNTNSQRVISFRGIRSMSVEDAQKLRVSRHDVVNIEHENSLFDDIFAPDPVTGNPNSDLFIRLQGDPTMREYIDRYLSNPVPSVAKIDEENKDLALNLVKSKYESASQYIERIRKYQIVLNDAQK